MGVVLTFPWEGSVFDRLRIGVQELGRLGIGVQVLCNSQARDWGDTFNSILYTMHSNLAVGELWRKKTVRKSFNMLFISEKDGNGQTIKRN